MIEGVILDLDGTVYRGEALIDGAAQAIAAIRDRNRSLVCCSNNPTKTPAEYVETLDALGIDVEEREVLPASTVTRSYLREHHPDTPTYLLGSDSLAAYLRAAGQTVVTDPDDATVYVASWDRRFDYETMRAARVAIDDETVFLGTDPDRWIPGPDGPLPGSGAIVDAIAGTVGREPDRVLGKPAPETAELALDRLGVDAANCLVVGDRLDTDLAMGAATGMETALVLTGVADRADIEDSPVEPDHVLPSLASLPEVLS